MRNKICFYYNKKNNMVYVHFSTCDTIDKDFMAISSSDVISLLLRYYKTDSLYQYHKDFLRFVKIFTILTFVCIARRISAS